MPLIFVYGTLKQGFPNAHINAGTRQPGRFRTRERFPLYLLGQGHVPCVVLSHGSGHQVHGEVYEVSEAALAVMDRLERLGEAIGYLRIAIDVEPLDDGQQSPLTAYVYAKSADQIGLEDTRAGPLDEYKLEHTALFMWQGAD